MVSLTCNTASDQLVPDDQLMVYLSQDHPEALSVLSNRWQPRLIRFGLRFLGDYQLAEDLAQEVWCRVYHNRLRYKAQGKFSPWIYRIATRIGLNLQQQQKLKFRTSSHASSHLTDESPCPEGQLHQQEQSHLLLNHLKALPEKQRTVLMMRFFDEMKFDDIARHTETAPSTIKSRFRAGLLRLCQELKRNGRIADTMQCFEL